MLGMHWWTEIYHENPSRLKRSKAGSMQSKKLKEKIVGVKKSQEGLDV